MFSRGRHRTDSYVKSAGAMSEIARDRARRTRKLTMNNSVRYEGNFVCRKRKREREKDGQAAKQTSVRRLRRRRWLSIGRERRWSDSDEDDVR